MIRYLFTLMQFLFKLISLHIEAPGSVVTDSHSINFKFNVQRFTLSLLYELLYEVTVTEVTDHVKKIIKTFVFIHIYNKKFTYRQIFSCRLIRLS
jgi:hypothetical protein